METELRTQDAVVSEARTFFEASFTLESVFDFQFKTMLWVKVMGDVLW